MNFDTVEIETMRWADADQTGVIIKTTDRRIISTPYNGDSVLWDKIQAFPVEQIGAYTPPALPVDPQP